MMCMLCKQNVALVHLTQAFSSGLKELTLKDLAEAKQVHLCNDCAKAENVDDANGFSLDDLLKKIATVK